MSRSTNRSGAFIPSHNTHTPTPHTPLPYLTTPPHPSIHTSIPQPHSAINIIGFNSPEWLIANCGAIAAGGVAVGIYTTNNVEACKYISEHSEAEVNKIKRRTLGVGGTVLWSVWID